MRRRLGPGALLGIGVFASLGWAMDSRADVPFYLTEQGRLFKADGVTPETGSTTMVFNIYTQATGGTSIWVATQTITLDAGYFSTELGGGSPTLSPALFNVATGRTSTSARPSMETRRSIRASRSRASPTRWWRATRSATSVLTR